MKRALMIYRLGILLVLTGLTFLTGCQDYDIDVVLDPEGGGTRSLVFEVNSKLSDDSEPTLGEYRTHFKLLDERRWQLVRQEEAAAESSLRRSDVTRFTHEVEVSDAAGWRDESGDIWIIGSQDRPELCFRNEIAVWTSTGSIRSLSYSETFTWTGIKEEIVEHQAERFTTMLRAEFPEMPLADLCELRGLIMGASLGSLRLSVTDADSAEQEALLRLFSGFALAIVQRSVPDSDEESVFDLVYRAIIDPDNESDRWLEQTLPGVDLALFTEINLNVTMPGPIIEHNADELRGNTAVWHINVFDAICQPVEISVRAELEN